MTETSQQSHNELHCTHCGYKTDHTHEYVYGKLCHECFEVEMLRQDCIDARIDDARMRQV
jgi:hypothetical protein